MKARTTPSYLGGKRLPLPQNTRTATTRLIRDAIVEGTLKPGRRLKEEELARELGISRTPVREALLALEKEGLVELPPKRGATIRAFTLEELEDAYDLRALLEGHAARLAAVRMTPATLRLLQKSCERFERLRQAENVRGLVKENLLFHDIILETAGSERLKDMAGTVIHLPLIYRSFFWYSPKRRAISGQYHERLVRCFGDPDPDHAELLMREHIFGARDILLSRMRDQTPEPEDGR